MFISLRCNNYTRQEYGRKNVLLQISPPRRHHRLRDFGFDGTRLQVLLIERGLEPYKGKWAFPGGFMKMDESAEQGAKRELMEETGMKAEYMEQFHAFTDPDRDPRERVITIAYYALCKIQDVLP